MTIGIVSLLVLIMGMTTVMAETNGDKAVESPQGQAAEKKPTPQGEKKVKKEKVAYKYVCPMGHYESGKPGKCPKCGMGLEKKMKDGSKQSPPVEKRK